jgi:hypothetical protein
VVQFQGLDKAVDYSITNITDMQIKRTAQVLTAICTLREFSAITLGARDRDTGIAWQRNNERQNFTEILLRSYGV